MKKLLVIFVMLFLVSCGSKEEIEVTPVEDVIINNQFDEPAVFEEPVYDEPTTIEGSAEVMDNTWFEDVNVQDVNVQDVNMMEEVIIEEAR